MNTLLVDRLARSAGRTLLTFAGAVVAIVVVWTVFLRTVNVSPFVAKSPGDVIGYLLTAPEAAANRSAIAADLTRTLADAAYGYVFGLGLAAAVALLFYFSRTVEAMFTPALTAMHAIPMVTVTPILVLIFGRGAFATAVIGAAVVVVPALLTMLHGIRATPRTDLDMITAFGASPLTAFRKVSLPHAIPTWFAAARVAVTTSVVGALLAEWLATGEGLGGQMLRAANEFQFDRLWASVVVLTLVCVVIYQVVAIVEELVATRMSAPR
ncbi:ABC transporter permease subunit [Nocardia sp. NPDC024068]|uniref:ABC transporter permease n=1 Tax=Nocardia sp. NPDC024068 TaxID=3157197 RepID=UPI0033EE751C